MNPIVAILLIGAMPPFQAQTLDGRSVAGTLTALSAERATIATNKGPVELPVEKLLFLTAKRPPRDGGIAITIELSDGSVVRAKQYTMTTKEARITLGNGAIVVAPADAIRMVRLQQGRAAASAEWDRLTATKVDSDMLIVLSGDAVDYHKGVLGEVTDEVVHFSLEGESLPVKRAKLLGFVRHQAKEMETSAAVCRISDASGSKWAARTVRLGKELQWTTPAGLTVSAPLEAIAEIDFSKGKLAYLSDLKPERVAWTPYFGGRQVPPALQDFYGPRFDRGFQTADLRLAGHEYSKGLALHSRTELVYRLPERYARLKATAGIDDAARPRGKVRLVIRGDDRVLFDATLSGTEPARELDIDLTDVRRVTILADFGATPPVDDLLLLCEARVLK